jgi:Leucine-rich repeat (LRR) protein
MPDNGFESLPSELSELRNLQSLDMSENAIGKIDNALLRSFDALEELNLGHNLLSTLDGLELPKSLLTFNVQNNQVFHNRFAISELYFTSMHF